MISNITAMVKKKNLYKKNEKIINSVHDFVLIYLLDGCA